MPRLILGVHAGVHDAAAVLFEDYTLKAAISLERLTRQKGDGGSHPDQCIDEVLAIAGASRRDVDAVAYSLALFPQSYYRLRGWRWLERNTARASRGKIAPTSPSRCRNPEPWFRTAPRQRSLAARRRLSRRR